MIFEQPCRVGNAHPTDTDIFSEIKYDCYSFVFYAYLLIFLIIAFPNHMRYMIAPSSLAGRGLGVGFLYVITAGNAVSPRVRHQILDVRYGFHPNAPYDTLPISQNMHSIKGNSHESSRTAISKSSCSPRKKAS